MIKKYNIGLDIGTTSIGWAIVESDTQKIIKKGNNQTPLWGVRLFEEAKTAEDRRRSRSTRRRYDRRRERIKLLQKAFENEINKVDPNFYNKLKESKYAIGDKNNKTILFSEQEKAKLNEYYKKYPTIYHLRNELICNDTKMDIRLVYLAIHHIIKYRGNFNYLGGNFDIKTLNLNDSFISLIDLFKDMCPECQISDNYEKIVCFDKLKLAFLSESKNDTKIYTKQLMSQISNNNQFINEFTKYALGNKFSIKKLFSLDDLEKDISISFSDADYEKKYSEIENILDEKIEILTQMKSFQEMVYLKKIFKNSDSIYLSQIKVETYLKHQEDLKKLKKLFDKDRKIYNQFFRDDKEQCLYSQYMSNKLTNNEFVQKIEKNLSNVLNNSDENLINIYNNIKEKIEKGVFLPKTNSTDNGAYPYQLNKLELIKIIENQGKYYPFLLNKTDTGEYKLIKLLEFKIPYYVGPLNSKSQFSWLEKNCDKKITPYNFDEIINKEATAEKFIKRMISRCTYLLSKEGEEPNYALPNCSILYSKFKVMNELKQIRINGNTISVNDQHKIFDELFMKKSGTITEKVFVNYLNSIPQFSQYNGIFNITGYSSDKKFANNMQSYIDFFGKDGFFNNTSYTIDDAENIIEWVTIFEDKDILENKIKKQYSHLDHNIIKKILMKKYSGWGNLCKKLLCDLTVKDKTTNTNKSIMDYMYESKENFMQILNNEKYNFQKEIAKNNKITKKNGINYELVENLATSPSIKKGIYQSLKVVDELVKYMGYDPENIIVEMARGTDKSGRKDNKKEYLLNLYEKNKNEIKDYNKLLRELNSKEKIDSEKLFLYFIQEGKCLYSGESIDIEQLNGDLYEIDHIIPQTLIKDNSIDNKALVYRKCNQNKAARFTLPLEYNNEKRRIWWNHLKNINLISQKKYYNLTKTMYKDEDIKGFINRQLVETRQITKHVTNILDNLYNKTNIIYFKASLSHDYREKNNMFKFRQLNDYHHAHDAYLAAALGEYVNKYTKKDINFNAIKELNHCLYENGEYKKMKYGYVINLLDEEYFDIANRITKNFVDAVTGEVLFDVEKFNKTVKNNLYRNDILVTRKPEIKSGELFNQTIYDKNKGRIRLKKNMPVEIYGGYSSSKTSYMVLVEYGDKKKIIAIPSSISKGLSKNAKIDYIREHLKIKDGINIKILKDRIPYYTLIEFNGQLTCITGYSIAHANSELWNARQFKLTKNEFEKYKDILNIVLNKDYEDKDFANNKHKYIDFVNKLFDSKKDYPLVINEITKIENKLELNSLSFNDFKKIIIEILKVYNYCGLNGNLKEFNLGDSIGRLTSKSLKSGKLIFTSTTGLKKHIYEF